MSVLKMQLSSNVNPVAAFVIQLKGVTKYFSLGVNLASNRERFF